MCVFIYIYMFMSHIFYYIYIYKRITWCIPFLCCNIYDMYFNKNVYEFSFVDTCHVINIKILLLLLLLSTYYIFTFFKSIFFITEEIYKNIYYICRAIHIQVYRINKYMYRENDFLTKCTKNAICLGVIKLKKYNF